METRDKSRRSLVVSPVIAHAVLAAFLLIVFAVPKLRTANNGPVALIGAVVIIELLFLVHLFMNRKKSRRKMQGCCDIVILVWGMFIFWELITEVFDKAPRVLVPCLADIFAIFPEQWGKMLVNVGYSLQLLAMGFLVGQAAALFAGLVIGWIPRLRDFFYPIASVLAPVPAIVFSPYLVALMPNFRSASMLVIFLGVFWPGLMGTINRVGGIEHEILDSSRMLNLGNGAMIFQVLLPYSIPAVISGLRVSLITSFLSLNFAEMMGSTHGLGYFVQNSIAFANYARAIAGIIVIGVVVTILNRVVVLVQRHAIPWK